MAMTRGSGSRGQSVVEFALILPMFLLLIVVVFDLGRAVYAQHTIENAARAAARVGIVDQTQANVINAAMAATVGLDPTAVNVAPTLNACSPMKIGCPVSVTVTYEFNVITPIVGQYVGTLDMTATTEIPAERIYVAP
jgi:Flp pilus assembly protein TadG